MDFICPLIQLRLHLYKHWNDACLELHLPRQLHHPQESSATFWVPRCAVSGPLLLSHCCPVLYVGTQLCHPKSQLGLSPLHPQFLPLVMPDPPRILLLNTKNWSPLRASPTGPGISSSLLGNQFPQHLACSSQHNQTNLTRGKRKTFSLHLQIRKKKNLSQGTWTQRKYNSSVLSIRWVI